MQNKCNRGCNAGFVPASSNWDFNIGSDWLRPKGGQQRGGRNQNAACSGGAQQTTRATRSADCGTAYDAAPAPCAREPLEDNRTVQCCGQNTTLRSQQETRETCADQYAGNGYYQNACTGQPNCTCESCIQARAAYSTCPDKGKSGCNGGYSRNTCTGQPDCACDRCTQARTAYAACPVNNTCPVNGGYTPCEAACSANTANAGSTGCYGGRGNLPAMVDIDVQQLGETFASESALRAGTLFPELHKPMNGYCPCAGNCGTVKQATAFAAWELRLYLDTHPDDQQALSLFRQLCREAGEENYATTFLPDSCCNTTSWNWTNSPWPWEYQGQCGD